MRGELNVGRDFKRDALAFIGVISRILSHNDLEWTGRPREPQKSNSNENTQKTWTQKVVDPKENVSTTSCGNWLDY